MKFKKQTITSAFIYHFYFLNVSFGQKRATFDDLVTTLAKSLLYHKSVMPPL